MTTPTAVSAAQIVRALACDRPGCTCHAAEVGRGKTHCPAHNDANPSFTVRQQDGKVLVKCQVGCSQQDVIDALRARGLWGTAPGRTTVYALRDVKGDLVAEHVRLDFVGAEKVCYWRQPDGTSGLNGTANTDMLYGLELLAGKPEAPVVVTEGEKAADALRPFGILALGTVTGAGAQKAPSLRVLWHLADRQVVLWPDNDDAGRRHMDRIAQSLIDLGVTPFVVDWPDAPAKGDAADFVTDHDDAELRELLHAAVAWQPRSAPDAPRSSWTPADLDAVLAGDVSPLEPTQLRRNDGVFLLYPGRVHDFHGEPETLKSWAAQVVAAEVLNDGGTVLYVDFEAEARDVVGHLLALGVPVQRVRDSLLYVRPDEALSDEARAALLAALDGRKPGLTVLDGVNNSLAASGFEPNSNADVRRWWDRLVRPLQLATPGPTVLIDHVAKDREHRGDWAVGAGQKKAGIDGASYRFDIIHHFGRGRTGLARVTVSKDRPGALRGREGPGREIAKLRLVSEAGADVTAELIAPQAGGEGSQESGQWRPTVYMERVSRVLEGGGEPLSKVEVERRVQGKAAHIRHALDFLIADGYVTVERGARNAALHQSARPYRDPDNPPTDPPTTWEHPAI